MLTPMSVGAHLHSDLGGFRGGGPFTGQESMGSDDPVDDPHLRHPEFFRLRQAETEEEDVELAEDSCLPSDNIQGNCSTFVSNRWN